ncbi:aspartate aminotransferase family protein [Micromonospora sp. NPDC049230]|uniref:aspartate aminotransferase family protein n=1 Tax=Micromonospora sp. NPDC049230 TaxID=3155502 RepID=UPI0033E39607
MSVVVNPSAPDPDRGRNVLEDDSAHIFRPWVIQGGFQPLAIAGGEGSWVWDYQGNRFLDFSSQLVVANLGHGHPKVVAAIKAQAEQLCLIAPMFTTEARTEAARLIAELAPDSLNRVLFTTSGSEAIENAIRMARLHTGRHKILSAYHSFHGSTNTAIQITGDPRRWSTDTATAGVARFFGPYLYRSPFHADTAEQECARALAHLEQVIVQEGAKTIAAVVMETVPGTSGGVLVPPEGYLAGVRELCDRYGIMLIFDEIMVGFGRTGRWFAFDHWDVRPDLVTFAKGVNSGYVPLAGVIVGDHIVDTFRQRPYPGGGTYSGHPLACASAVAAITAMKEEGVVEHAAWLGENVFGPRLAEIAERHPSVGEVRGLGAIWAIELVRNRGTRQMWVDYENPDRLAPHAMQLFGACLSLGLLPNLYLNRLHVTPPCTISAADAEEGLARIDQALAVADQQYEQA